jgi:LPS-assembly protein
MKNKKKFLVILVLSFLFNFQLIKAAEPFNFNVTEIEILEEGNIFKGFNGGTATTDEGLVITADNFDYNKSLNILITTGNVVINDTINDYEIFADKITYFRNQEKILTSGKTKAIIEKNFIFHSTNVVLFKNQGILLSPEKSTIIDDEQTFYQLDKFEYTLDNKTLKGENIKVTTNYNKDYDEKDFYEFKDGIFNLKNKDFVASDTKISAQKSIFDVSENDPRLYGVSSNKKGQILTVNKGVFTSCADKDSCPPWSIKSKKIIHDKDKRQIIYDHSILKIYDVPVLYFPKFFHPDPTVKRQSGFLQPQLNNSKILGSSLIAPYFYVISESKDATIKPTIFDSDIMMLSSEYRQENKKSSFIADLGLTKNYKSSSKDNNKNSIGHLFSKYNLDLGFKNFEESTLLVALEKVTNDTYLKVFDTNLINTDKQIKPSNQNQLTSNITLDLNHEDFSLTSGFTAYEKLNGLSSDRYEYVLPYYNLSSANIYDNDYGNFSFSSDGSNNLRETNNLKSVINNNFEFETYNFISKKGFKNMFGAYFKNTNTVAKNDSTYKSSPQVELSNIYNFESSLPLIKVSNKSFNTLSPKLSFRINPGDMKDYTDTDKHISTDNIFGINRLGIGDSFEQGKSLTLGVDYTKESLTDVNKYFEFNLAKVIRDLRQDNIPRNSSIGQKSSNIFGSATINLIKGLNVNYDFSVDNDLNTFEYNSLSTELSLPNFVTEFNYREDNGKMGDTNFLENKTTLNFREENFLTFKTRRNRTINLTEYYDLIYEYQNDCLIAGFKYRKTYYQDRDVKPNEDLILTVTLFPLTQYEQKIDQNLYRD